jgi:UDP-GlcNAc:undecaprenyl-phosphate GlcNAc-1-phosphate transferase
LDVQSEFFIYNKQIIAIIICSTFIFIFGLLDDKYNLGSLTKSLCFIFFITIFVLNDIKSEIFYLKFDTFDKILTLDRFSLFFTIFSVFVFMNALNMYDGINLQSGLYLIFLSIIFLFKSIDPIFFLINIICLIFFTFYNYKNKIFMGNNGIYLLSFIFGIFFIKSNVYLTKISTEEILILMAIPGIDMIRLFFIRIINGKNPFLGDNKHIHHLLLNKFREKTAIIVFSLTLFPFVFFHLFGLIVVVFLLQIFSYFLVIKLSKNR